MLNRADLFALYIEFYNKWFLFHGASLHYVKGDLYKYKRNIICVYSESQIKSLVLAKSAYFTRRNDIPCFCLVGSRYVLEGADIDKDCQYIFYSDKANEMYTPKLNHEGKYICLVAYQNQYIDDNSHCIGDDYHFKYEVCHVNEITNNHRPIEYSIIYHADAIKTLNCYIDKKHDYKTAINLPIEAIPHTLGSNRMCGLGKEPPISNYNWYIATGIGIVGSGTNDIRCIDIDGCQSEEFLNSFLEAIGLAVDYSWIVETGSGEGYHIWIWCENLPNNLLLKGESRKIFEKSNVLYFVANRGLKYTFKSIEIRWNSFCMLPPSIGPNGKEYVFRNGIPKEGFQYVDSKVLFDNLLAIASNSTVDYTNIVTHDTYDVWSDDDETECLFMCFDTETTGLPKNYNKSFKEVDNWPHIVQLSYSIFQYVDNEIKELDRKNFILKPKDYVIPNETSKIHGITNEKAINEGYLRADVLNYVAEQLTTIDYLIGHNVEFDINVLRAEFEREGIDVESQFNHLKSVCTMKGGIKLYPEGTKWPKLEKLYYDLTKKTMLGAHNAINDVGATMKCFEILVNKNILHVKKKIRLKDFNTKYIDW